MAYRKEQGDKHNAALRNIANRLVGCLWHCLVTGEIWDDEKAWRAFYVPAQPATNSEEEPDVDETLSAAQEALALLNEDDDTDTVVQ